jgi:hypothetical protein
MKITLPDAPITFDFEVTEESWASTAATRKLAEAGERDPFFTS